MISVWHRADYKLFLFGRVNFYNKLLFVHKLAPEWSKIFFSQLFVFDGWKNFGPFNFSDAQKYLYNHDKSLFIEEIIDNLEQ